MVLAKTSEPMHSIPPMAMYAESLITVAAARIRQMGSKRPFQVCLDCSGRGRLDSHWRYLSEGMCLAANYSVVVLDKCMHHAASCSSGKTDLHSLISRTEDLRYFFPKLHPLLQLSLFLDVQALTLNQLRYKSRLRKNCSYVPLPCRTQVLNSSQEAPYWRTTNLLASRNSIPRH